MPVTARTKSGIVGQVLREKRAGNLNIGKSDKKVRSRKQAIAIALDIARRRGVKS